MKTKKVLPIAKTLSEKYELIEDPNDDSQWLVRLKVEPWTGITYKYLTFKLKEDAGKDRLVCKFDYEIIEEMLPEHFKGKEFTDEQGKEFVDLIGDIVIELLQEQLSSK